MSSPVPFFFYGNDYHSNIAVPEPEDSASLTPNPVIGHEPEAAPFSFISVLFPQLPVCFFSKVL
jgi:hypothetical protein